MVWRAPLDTLLSALNSPMVDPLGDFERLVAEAATASIDGWDFSWFEGRASEEQPPWGYAHMLPARIGAADAALGIQTGGGEVFAEVLQRSIARPRALAATESWPPNVREARRRLGPLGVTVVEPSDDVTLPFAAESFDLVVSRHPIRTEWGEIERVMRRGGTYLSQQVGPGSNLELIEFFLGTQTVGDSRSPQRARALAEAAGLAIVDLREARLRTVFHDVGAVIYFLRKVIWTVPDFSVDRYRDRLEDLHRQMTTHGPFVTHSQRFLIEASKA